MTDEEKHNKLLKLMEKLKTKNRIIKKQQQKARSLERKIEKLLNEEE